MGGGVDWKALAAAAKPATRNVDMCLRGDLVARLEQAREQDPHGDLAELEQAVSDATVTFVIQGLTRNVYRTLEAKYPAEDGAGWDMEQFPEALVRACLLEPVVADDDPFFSVLTPGQVDRLFETAFRACNQVDDLPLRKRG